MNIAINALSAQTGGGVSVFINLLPYLDQLDSTNLYTVFYSPEQQRLIAAVPRQFHKVRVRGVPRQPYFRVLWEQCILPWYLRRHNIDLLYSVGNTTSLFAPCKVVLLIENANSYSRINLPWSRKEQLRFLLLRTLGWLSARKAAKIRFVSNNSRDLIVPQLRVSADKCVVIPHGVSIANNYESNASNTNIYSRNSDIISIHSRPYLLTIGANGPHRNTERLLQAFALLVRKYGYDGNLVVVGNTGSSAWSQALDKLVRKLELSGRVVFVGEVPHGEISTYFRQAEAFIFPSIEETFGIPLLEAMKFGVPIIAADCDLDSAYRGKCFNPFQEICADAAEYFNPFKPEEMTQSVHRVLTDVALRERLIMHGKERVGKYNLENTVRALVKLFDTIVSPP